MKSCRGWSELIRKFSLELSLSGTSQGRRCEVVLLDGLRVVRRNKGKARVDGASIEESTRHLEQNPTALMRDLKQRTYPPRPVRRVMISKGFGRTRPPDIPNVRERVAQEEPFRLRSPLFERLFHDDSYGFRPGCSCHMALERVREIHRTGCRYVLDADISGFFDQIPHAVIMRGGQRDS